MTQSPEAGEPAAHAAASSGLPLQVTMCPPPPDAPAGWWAVALWDTTRLGTHTSSRRSRLPWAQARALRPASAWSRADRFSASSAAPIARGSAEMSPASTGTRRTIVGHRTGEQARIGPHPRAAQPGGQRRHRPVEAGAGGCARACAAPPAPRSRSTVESHFASIYRKLHIKSRKQLRKGVELLSVPEEAGEG